MCYFMNLSGLKRGVENIDRVLNEGTRGDAGVPVHAQVEPEEHGVQSAGLRGRQEQDVVSRMGFCHAAEFKGEHLLAGN